MSRRVIRSVKRPLVRREVRAGRGMRLQALVFLWTLAALVALWVTSAFAVGSPGVARASAGKVIWGDAAEE